jgi:hypothetical protein
MSERIDTYDKARADAQKILGKDGRLPKDDGGLKKDIAEFTRCSVDTIKAKELAGTRLIAWKKAIDAVKESAQAYSDDVEGSDFDLDPKNPKQAKQIADVQKILGDALKFYETGAEAALSVAEATYKVLFSTEKQWDKLQW